MSYHRVLILAALLPGLEYSGWAQKPDTAAVEPGAAPVDQTEPTWETQKLARTYLLGIPAPRGQITDRNGKPLAQNRVSNNLAINFPTPPDLSDTRAIAFGKEQVAIARSMLEREITISDEAIAKHYKNRAILPLDIATNLQPNEVETVKKRAPAHLGLHAVYQRFYPNANMAGHIIGYTGRMGRALDGPIQNNELLWPDAEGREGLEQTFNEQLSGQNGQMNMSFDARGKKSSEKISIPPQQGYNVVTTLDENIQRLAEQALAQGSTKGAMVIIDPGTGDILAMASWPVFNPNAFIPNISTEAFKSLNENPNLPLVPRAFRATYPPGSTFKVFVGLAALQSDAIGMDDEFNCPSALEVGNIRMRNWKKEGAGMLNFADALTQSCNTWFYQVGMKTGGAMIGEWANKVGLGVKTGIPLGGEAEGRIPNDEYMRKVHGRRLLDGDVANLSIGQGDILISPLQMAQAMAVVANGGTLYQTRLVQQVQSIDNQIVTAYDVRAKSVLEIRPEIMAEVRKAMTAVVSSRMGTAGQAQVPGIDVAGKTGTAQWGPKNKERTAAWFAGFAPTIRPQYAFAVLYEGAANNDDVHGGTYAAPLIGKVLRSLFTGGDAPRTKAKKAGRRKRRTDAQSEGDVEPRVLPAQPVVPENEEFRR